MKPEDRRARPRSSAGGDIAAPLLRWYDRSRRDLPWRRTPNPYRTLVSEFMLQQTVVATVEPYFARFTRRFPTIEALAAASEDDVMALWSGLGYYARARNLHRAARAVVSQHGGVLPADEEALRRLPGIGAYTAAAVAAIGFDVRAFALDGNAARVLARLLGVTEPLGPKVRANLAAWGLAQVPARRAGDFNQAVMELGALVCTARRPRCADCPLSQGCIGLGRGEDVVAAIPAKRIKPARPVVRVVCAYVTHAGRVLLVRRPPGQLLAGTWALPSAPLDGTGDPTPAVHAAVAGSGIAVGAASPAFRGRVRHIFTHRDLTADVYALPAALTGAGRAADADEDDQNQRWVDPRRLAELGVSTFTQKTLRVARGHGVSPVQKCDTTGAKP
ncbi:MAG TPA: A/G-specific adenine glycosylase [Polyangia bacterium]|nr:A/G-specific adenine glycosylase [Polyangia bacterium]